MANKYERESMQIARAAAKLKAEHSGKPSDWGFRSKPGGEMVGVVVAKPNGKSETKRFGKRK
ncbi:MAG: hypothetical protein E6Q97_31010 [Desulfurellales bacterium]|nr:MAG: hypothetical protein E6Q97_31010 [Desulfurellales bacterium]